MRPFPPKTGLSREIVDGFDRLLRERYTGTGRITGTDFFSASTSIIFAAADGVGAGEDGPPPEAVASLLEATSF